MDNTEVLFRKKQKQKQKRSENKYWSTTKQHQYVVPSNFASPYNRNSMKFFLHTLRHSVLRKLTVNFKRIVPTTPHHNDLTLSNQHNLYRRCSKDASRWQITHLTRFSGFHDILTCCDRKREQRNKKLSRMGASFPFQSHGRFNETDHHRFMWHLIKIFAISRTLYVLLV